MPGSPTTRPSGIDEFLDQIHQGDCRDLLRRIPCGSVDLVFADPPYNLQLKRELHRPDQSLVDGVDDHWDQFKTFKAYDKFTTSWLTEVRRVLKDDGALWVIGSYHNIYRVGSILQDLGFWILNDVLWIKNNPMPNFRGTRFNNAHETLLWAAKSDGTKYTFNYQSMKAANDDIQMRSDWMIPLCTGGERLKTNGEKTHSTQKPEALLNRVLQATSKPGDIVLDPFSGSGTTAAVAKRLGRHFIGLEREGHYVQASRARLEKVIVLEAGMLIQPLEVKLPRVPFAQLLDAGLVEVGEELGDKKGKITATVLANGTVQYGDFSGSIHKAAAMARGLTGSNGWDFWYVQRDGKAVVLDDLRNEYRQGHKSG